MPKQIELVSNQAILIDAAAALESVNELRKESGDGKKGKKPMTLDQFIATTKVLEERTPDFGMITLNLSYKNQDAIPSSRNFPNFGLAVISKSTLALAGQNIEVQINLIVKAEKKKWQLDEVAECVDVLSSKDTIFGLRFTSDETTDRAGYDTPIKVANGLEDRYGNTFIPSSFFTASFK